MAQSSTLSPPSVWHLLWQLYGRLFLVSAAMQLASVLLQFVPQLLLNAFLHYIETGGQGHGTIYGYGIATLMFLTTCVSVILGSRGQTLLFRLGARTRGIYGPPSIFICNPDLNQSLSLEVL